MQNSYRRKNLINISCVMVLGAIFSLSIAFAQQTNNVSTTVQFKEHFVQSIIPIENIASPIKEVSDPYSLYENHLVSIQSDLSGVFQIDKNQSPYKIKKLLGDPHVFVGYPSYLSPKNSPSDEELKRGLDKIKGQLATFVGQDEMINMKISENAQISNVFLLPVTPKTFIEVLNPNVRISPLLSSHYDGVLQGLERVFPNHNIYQLNSENLKGTFLNDPEGRIIISYCPVDVSLDSSEIRKNIFYCIVQSQGLSGFYKRYPNLDDDARLWSQRLVNVIGCNEIQPNQNVFDIDFEKTINQCQKAKD